MILRKIKRILKTGSLYTSDYRAYRSYLQKTSDSAPVSYFNLTIDLELAWSRARRGDASTSREESLERSRRIRKVFPSLISLSKKYNIPLTFAVVGHVALESCSQHSQLPFFHPRWTEGDWYGIDPNTDLATDPDYYGADLIAKIKNSGVGHEIASHGFSHVDLSDSETAPEVAKFEIEESYRLLKKIEPELTTYVFPKNQPAFVDIIKNAGFLAYRDSKNHAVRKNADGLIEFPLGLWLSPKAHSPKDLSRLLAIAAKRKLIINFWLHLYEFDSVNEAFSYFEPIFSYVDICRTAGTMKAQTMRDIVKFYAPLEV